MVTLGGPPCGYREKTPGVAALWRVRVAKDGIWRELRAVATQRRRTVKRVYPN